MLAIFTSLLYFFFISLVIQIGKEMSSTIFEYLKIHSPN